MQLPTVSDQSEEFPTGKFLEQLSYSTSIESLDKLIAPLTDSSSTFHELKVEENRLRNADSGQEQRNLTRQAEKLDALHKHIASVHSALGNDGLAKLRTSRAELKEFKTPQHSWLRPLSRTPYLESAAPLGRPFGTRQSDSLKSRLILAGHFPSWKTKVDVSCVTKPSTQRVASGYADSSNLSKMTLR